MKRIEVSLNVGMIAPLLDFLQPVLQALKHETALAPEMAEADRDLAGLWREGLIHTQVDAKVARRGHASAGGGDVASQLEKLEGMLQRGTLTPSEFEAQKRKLLGA